MSDAMSDLRSVISQDILAALKRDQTADVQRALSQFSALLDSLGQAEITTFAIELRAIAAALGSEKPNILFAERTIAGIDNSLMISRGLISRWLYKSTNGSPILAVYGALMLSIFSYILIFLVYRIVDLYGGLPGFLWASGQEFLITVTFAFLGAIVSIAFRLDLSQIERVGMMPLFLTNLVKPYIGAMFGIVVFCIISSKLVMIAGVNDAPLPTVAKMPGDEEQVWFQNRKILIHDYLFFFISALIGFLAGFSERFATDLINRSEQIFGQKNKDGSNP